MSRQKENPASLGTAEQSSWREGADNLCPYLLKAVGHSSLKHAWKGCQQQETQRRGPSFVKEVRRV